MKELHDLELMLRSHFPILVIETLEELRVLRLFNRLAMRLDHPVFRWSVTEGIKRLVIDSDPTVRTAEPTDALRHIKAVPNAGHYVLLDFHPYLGEPVHVRLIKEIAQEHELTPRSLVFVSHALEIPVEVRHFSARFALQLPDKAELLRLIEQESQAWQARNGGRSVRSDRGAVHRLADNLMGVSASDARRMIRSAIENDAAITHSDLPEVMKAKHQLISQEGMISFEYDTARFSDMAGLDNLKRWLEQRRESFLGARSSLDPPKGILLLGVQGCGKSLAAKAVAGGFGVPLLRLDFAALYNKYIGETEKNLRQALQTAELMAPCILWLDEIEKGIAQGENDDGLARRVLGSLLTWMAERKARVFLVATANDIGRLPPELIRKGRMDEIFFVDLPDADTRGEIFAIHLRRRNLAPSAFDLTLLRAASEGFSGAEIEQAVVSALYAAEAQGDPLDNRHLLAELARTRPLSVVMAEHVASLRAWAAERTVPA